MSRDANAKGLALLNTKSFKDLRVKFKKLKCKIY